MENLKNLIESQSSLEVRQTNFTNSVIILKDSLPVLEFKISEPYDFQTRNAYRTLPMSEKLVIIGSIYQFMQEKTSF